MRAWQLRWGPQPLRRNSSAQTVCGGLRRYGAVAEWPHMDQCATPFGSVHSEHLLQRPRLRAYASLVVRAAYTITGGDCSLATVALRKHQSHARSRHAVSLPSDPQSKIDLLRVVVALVQERAPEGATRAEWSVRWLRAHCASSRASLACHLPSRCNRLLAILPTQRERERERERGRIHAKPTSTATVCFAKYFQGMFCVSDSRSI